MPISFASIGEPVKIKKITGNDQIRLHLAELGFVVGEVVTVVSKIDKNIIVKVKESRIAIDNSMAMRILF